MATDMEWLAAGLGWNTTDTLPDWGRSLHGDGKAISNADVVYVYYSPFRPLNWVLDGIGTYFVVPTCNPGADLVYCSTPLTAERLNKWELVPVNPAARDHAQALLDKD